MKRLLEAGLCLAFLLAFGIGAAAAARHSLAYHWPIKPFDQQHPIRAAFGDPRTLDADAPFGETSPSLAGYYSFHNGVDIVAVAGTPVYPVVSGVVAIATTDEIAVHTRDGRSFQYMHLLSDVHRGEKVVAYRTVLGTIQQPYNHVHLAEIDNARAQNPLAPGHLEPYSDHTRPEVTGLYVYDGDTNSSANGIARVTSRERVAVAAEDPPPMAEPGWFSGLPQAPALVQWRLRIRRTWTSWRVASDFRRTEPPSWDFWKVYAPGTFQNAPVFEHQLFRGTPGVYLFWLPIHPSVLAPGRDELEVQVSDIRGNRSVAYAFLDVVHGR